MQHHKFDRKYLYLFLRKCAIKSKNKSPVTSKQAFLLTLTYIYNKINCYIAYSIGGFNKTSFMLCIQPSAATDF